MLVHCYPVIVSAAVVAARPFRRIAHRAVGSGARKPHHGGAAITKPAVIGEVCRRVPGGLPGAFGALAPAAVGAALAGLAGAGLAGTGFAGSGLEGSGAGLAGSIPAQSAVASGTGSGLDAGRLGGLIQGVPDGLSFMVPDSPDQAQVSDRMTDAVPAGLPAAGLELPGQGVGPGTGSPILYDIVPGTEPGRAARNPGASIPRTPFTPGSLPASLPAQLPNRGQPSRSSAAAVAEPATLLVLAVGGLAAVVACRSGRRIG